MGDRRRLPESELDIMLALWRRGGRATAPELLEGLDRSITASALHSYLKRLEEKGFLACKKMGKTNVYTPLITREEYQKSEGRSMLRKLYGNSLSRFAAALYDGERVDAADVAELQSLLDRLKRGGERDG